MERIGEEQKMTTMQVAENGKPTLLTGQQVYETKKTIVPRDLTLKSKLGDVAKAENSVTDNPGIEILPLQMR